MRETRTIAILTGLAMLALSACQRHSEAELRGLLGRWLMLGATVHLQSQADCTAFQAQTEREAITAALGPVSRLEEARRRMRAGHAVAVHLPGQTAAYVSEWFANTDFGLGLTIINAARAARPCMSPAFKTGFVEALQHPRTVLIFDPATLSLTIFDRDGGMLYHMRGAS